MRRDNNDALWIAPAVKQADDVHARPIFRAPSSAEREAVLERFTDRLEAGLLEAADDVRARAIGAWRADATALHRIRRERLQIPHQLRAVDGSFLRGNLGYGCEQQQCEQTSSDRRAHVDQPRVPAVAARMDSWRRRVR